MPSDDAPRPALPTTVDEWLRIAHALRWGAHVSGTSVYIVMSNVAPLYQIQGITTKLEDAQKLIRTEVSRLALWTRDEIDNRKLYGPIAVPETSYDNAFVPIGKGWYTGSYLAEEIIQPSGGKPPAPNEITKVQMRVEWTHEGRKYTGTWEFFPETMAIFLTRGAAEMFLYPHDEAFFGYEHEDALRARNSQTR
ncbi:MAG TPA: hypothetical protein VGP84_05315 [Gemmatimonadaceae bacterium]|jgi:hypothetical protein|nr:hypothetical protein [Gemmatimonadaceae bacterium]